MPERRAPRLLPRLLPRRAAEELFEPAWRDLQIARLEEPARRGRYVLRLLGIFLDRWRLVLGDPSHYFAATTLPIPEPSSPERMHMILYHLRHALRRLIKEPAFSIAAILTLAVGVGANVAVFTVVEAVLLRPLPYPDATALVTLNHRDERTGITKEFIAIGDFVDLAARQTAFEGIAPYSAGQSTVYDATEPYRVSELQTTSELMRLMRVRPVLGRLLEANDAREGAPPVVVLGYDLWKTRFGGDRAVLGRALKIDRNARTIVGVAAEGFRFPANAKTDIITSTSIPLVTPTPRKSGWTFAVARLKPAMTVERGGRDIASISKQMARDFPVSNQGSMYFVMPLRDALVGNTKPALLLLLGAVAVVLLIACANVANLLLARSLSRHGEMALRVALGAGRGRLAAQLLAESLVLALTASAAGLVIAHWGTRALVSLVPRSMNLTGLAEVRLDGTVLAFALLVTVGVTLVFGLVALFTTRTDNPASVLVGGARATMSAKSRRTTSALVVVEVAFAVVLLVGAGLILRSFAGLMRVDPGFRAENVMTMEIALPPGRYADSLARSALYERAFASLRALPGVRDAGAAVVVPLTGNNWTVPFARPEHPVPAGERAPDVGWQVASGGYFSALRIPLVAGRLFDTRDRPGGNPVVIISDAIQRRFFPGENPVGHLVKLGKSNAEIVGVVGSIRRAGLQDEPRADMYFPFEQAPGDQITLFIRTASAPELSSAALQRALRDVEPGTVIVSTRSLADISADSVRVTELVLWLLGVFAVTALALAAIGIYGVMSYVVRQRTRELGTRIALGASRQNILWLVLRQGAVIAGIGAALGVVASLIAARSIRSILYATSSADPLVLVVASLVLVAATMLACFIPARRAASVDPAKTLAQS